MTTVLEQKQHELESVAKYNQLVGNPSRVTALAEIQDFIKKKVLKEKFKLSDTVQNQKETEQEKQALLIELDKYVWLPILHLKS